MNTEDTLFEIIVHGKCKCGAIGRPEQNCPYAEEINNDPNSTCNCCEECTQNCCDDI